MRTNHVVVGKISVLPQVSDALYPGVHCDFISCLYLQGQRHSGSNQGYRRRDVTASGYVISSSYSHLEFRSATRKTVPPRTMLTRQIYKLLIKVGGTTFGCPCYLRSSIWFTVHSLQYKLLILQWPHEKPPRDIARASVTCLSVTLGNTMMRDATCSLPVPFDLTARPIQSRFHTFPVYSSRGRLCAPVQVAHPLPHTTRPSITTPT